MTPNYFQQYIVGYTVANFLRYPIRCRITKASALEYQISQNAQSANACCCNKQVIDGFASACAIIHSLKLVDYFTVQTHKLYNNVCISI